MTPNGSEVGETTSTNDSRLLRSGSLNSSHRRHGRMAGGARSNRLEIIRILATTLLPFNLHPFLLFNPLQLLTELAVCPDSIAVADKRERNQRDPQAEEGKETARPVYAESIEHGLRGEWEDGTEDASCAARGGLSACG